ncbi:hypothetical protein D3C71_1666010 [compost metagenome]
MQSGVGQHGTRPRPVVLGGEVPAASLAQVGVHGARIHRVLASVLVQILEELLAWNVQATPDDASHAAVRDSHVVGHAALALELETEAAAGHRGVAPLERGQTIGFIGAGILARPDADQRDLQQTHQYGDHLILCQAGRFHVPRHLSPDAGQRQSE